MDIELDPAKDLQNIRKHGISLKRAEDFDLDNAVSRIDSRKDYGEVRYRSVGLIGEELHMLVFTLRGDKLRAISLRTANRKERKQYAKNS